MVQDAPLHRLQTVLHARQRALQDDVLGIGHHATRQHLLKRRLDDLVQAFLKRLLGHVAP